MESLFKKIIAKNFQNLCGDIWKLNFTELIDPQRKSTQKDTIIDMIIKCLKSETKKDKIKEKKNASHKRDTP